MAVWLWMLCGGLSALRGKVLFDRINAGFGYNCFWKIAKEGNGVIVLFFIMRGSKDKLVVPNLSFSEFVPWRYSCTLNSKYGSFIDGYAFFKRCGYVGESIWRNKSRRSCGK